MNSLSPLLQSFGLNEKEILVFLSLVKQGQCLVSDIAKDTGITRTLIYDIAEELQAKGLVSEHEENGKKQYQAVDHAGLMAQVSAKKRQIETLEKNFLHAASAFHNLAQTQTQRTHVRFFSGVDGIKTVYAEVLKDLQEESEPIELLSLFSPNMLENSIPGWTDIYDDFFNVGVKIKNYHIMCNTPEATRYQEKFTQSCDQHEWRLWDKAHGEFPTDTFLWKDKIVYIDLAGYPSGIVIENAAIAESTRMWFWMMWEALS